MELHATVLRWNALGSGRRPGAVHAPWAFAYRTGSELPRKSERSGGYRALRIGACPPAAHGVAKTMDVLEHIELDFEWVTCLTIR
jgi:hypothetical protein